MADTSFSANNPAAWVLDLSNSTTQPKERNYSMAETKAAGRLLPHTTHKLYIYYAAKLLNCRALQLTVPLQAARTWASVLGYLETTTASP